ncbi:C4-dicarboxylate transport system permease small protein [Halalkalibacter wakoensis JCM 9140]|uniref:C4-dicarboxylate transport system permease small protein n=1 Tax=Halalkalibacter wakoensis JCM 9140 TaxID=1236970 RepID=W4Q7X2_9BACI|nr:TRAP transporter small permease [Halalkalibacter wakoensis]GAE28092.1 C4-dicarboxylate transport system permease small protein [Halalkalibacter wakoensis JCM 9140]
MSYILKQLDRVEQFIIALGIISTSVIIFFNVISRYFFNSGVVWAEEAVRYMIIIIVLIGSSLAISKNEHIAVSLLEKSSIKWLAHLMYGIQNVASLVFTVIVTYYGWVVTSNLRDIGQISPALEIPLWFIYLAFPVGTFLMSIRFLVRIIDWIRTREIPTREEGTE